MAAVAQRERRRRERKQEGRGRRATQMIHIWAYHGDGVCGVCSLRLRELEDVGVEGDEGTVAQQPRGDGGEGVWPHAERGGGVDEVTKAARRREDTQGARESGCGGERGDAGHAALRPAELCHGAAAGEMGERRVQQASVGLVPRPATVAARGAEAGEAGGA